jgi:hypothetical protein
MKKDEIALSTNFVRDHALTEYYSTGIGITEYIILNTLPVEKIDDKHVISDFTEYLDLDGYLPLIKKDTDNTIVKFININLTNIINRKLTMSIPGVLIEDFLEDRKGLIELIRDDEEISSVINKIDFKAIFNYSNNAEDIAKFYDEDITVTYLVAKNNIKIIVINETELLHNDILDEKGGIFRLTKNLKLFKAINRVDPSILTDDDEYIIYGTDGKSYLLSKSIYDYPTIKKFNISEYQSLNIAKY